VNAVRPILVNMLKQPWCNNT